jgi:hypothetical protein
VFFGLLLRQVVVGLGLKPGNTGAEIPNETTRRNVVDEGEKDIKKKRSRWIRWERSGWIMEGVEGEEEKRRELER